MPTDNFLFSELSLTSGQPFEAVAPGTFTASKGQRVSIAPSDLQAIVDNTREVLESTRTASGELVGLPIDMDAHDHRGGAGWIVGTELKGGKIVNEVKWTDAGKNVIASGERRFFSPSLDLGNMVQIGGSLTNWPASRDGKQRLALRPIELSAHVYELAAPDESLDDKVEGVRKAFMDSIMQPMMQGMPYVCEIFDGYVIAEDGETKYKVTYTVDAMGTYTFAPRNEWVEVKETYVEAAMRIAKETIEKALSTPKKEGVKPMPTNLLELAATPEGAAELAALVEKQSQTRVTELLQKEQRKNRVAELCAELTGGTKDHPQGLPVKKDELVELMSSLSDEAAAKLESILRKIQTDGLVDFSEHGTNGETKGKKELPGAFKNLLKSWVDAGKPVAEWFAVNADLAIGVASDYDLAEFATEGK